MPNAIAEDMVDEAAEYCLPVKGNQSTLHDGLIDFFDDHLEDDFARHLVRRLEINETTCDRRDLRTYFICPVPDDLPDGHRWKGLKVIGIAINNTVRNGKAAFANRYYLLSRYVSATRFAEAVRNHWRIENNLHWQLDVTINEDQSRIRKGHANINLSTLRRTAFSLLKKENTARVGIKSKRLNAAWNGDYRIKVLLGK